MDDSGQQTADLHELLIEHRHAGHLAKLDQAAHATQHDGAGGILGDVVVGPGFEARQNVGIVVADRQHQDRHTGDLAVGANRAADLEPAHVGQVDVEDDDVRPHFPGLVDRFSALGNLVNRVAGPTEDGSKQGAIRRAIIDDQDGPISFRSVVRFPSDLRIIASLSPVDSHSWNHDRCEGCDWSAMTRLSSSIDSTL